MFSYVRDEAKRAIRRLSSARKSATRKGWKRTARKPFSRNLKTACFGRERRAYLRQNESERKVGNNAVVRGGRYRRADCDDRRGSRYRHQKRDDDCRTQQRKIRACDVASVKGTRRSRRQKAFCFCILSTRAIRGSKPLRNLTKGINLRNSTSPFAAVAITSERGSPASRTAENTR